MKTSTNKSKLKKQQVKSGYKSERLKHQHPKPKPRPAAPVLPKKPAIPLPGKAQGVEGELLSNALKAKVRLLKQLIKTVGNPVSVSIEVYNDEWVLLVHGPNPQIRYFDNYKVFWARSKVLGGT